MTHVRGRRAGARRFVAIGVAVGLAALAASLGACGEPVKLRTAEVRFDPLTTSGEPQPQLDVRRAVGACSVGSSLVSRADAWRCRSGKRVFDPCFAGKRRGIVVCVSHPWSDVAAELRLREPLDAGLANPPSGELEQPWALELANAMQCRVEQGATRLRNERRRRYFCADGSILYGVPDRSGAPWTIERTDEDSDEMHLAGIRTAWF